MERRLLKGSAAARPVARTRERRLRTGTRLVSAVRPEPVQVQLSDDRPARFVWRGRLYTVLSVIERPGQRAALGTSEGEGEAAEHDHRPGEWRCWRVTASPGKNVPAVPFRLCQEPSADRWELTRE